MKTTKADETCWDCAKPMVRKKVGYSLFGIQLGEFQALECPNCKEPFFSEETSKKIIAFARLKKGTDVTITPESRDRMVITV